MPHTGRVAHAFAGRATCATPERCQIRGAALLDLSRHQLSCGRPSPCAGPCCDAGARRLWRVPALMQAAEPRRQGRDAAPARAARCTSPIIGRPTLTLARAMNTRLKRAGGHRRRAGARGRLRQGLRHDPPQHGDHAVCHHVRCGRGAAAVARGRAPRRGRQLQPGPAPTCSGGRPGAGALSVEA